MKKTILALAIASTLSAPASAGFSFGDLADKAKSIGGDVLTELAGPQLGSVDKDTDCSPYVDHSATYQQCHSQRSAAMKQYQEEQRVASVNRKAEAQRRRDLAQEEANREYSESFDRYNREYLAQEEANRKDAEVRAEQEKQERIAKKQERIAKEEAEKSSAESLATAHIDSLTLMSKDELAVSLESGIPGRVSADDASYDIGFIVKIDGVQLSKDYRFKGEVVCFDEWDDQVGRGVDVTGDVIFDTSGQMEYSFGSMQNVEQKKFAGTWVVSQWNIMHMGITYLESQEIVECRFDSLRIK